MPAKSYFLPAILALSAAACGSNSESNRATASDGHDEGNPAGSENDDATPSDSDAGETDGPTIRPFDRPDHLVADAGAAQGVAPGVDPDTPIDELSPEDFTQACGSFLDGVDRALQNLAASCEVRAVGEALDSEPESTDEFRSLCVESRDACEISTAAIQEILGLAECEQQGECEATVAELDACREELTLADAILLEPLASIQTPPCEELTPVVAQAIQLQVLTAVIATAAENTDETGSNPFSEEGDSACDALGERCPSVLPTGAFESP